MFLVEISLIFVIAEQNKHVIHKLLCFFCVQDVTKTAASKMFL